MQPARTKTYAGWLCTAQDINSCWRNKLAEIVQSEEKERVVTNWGTKDTKVEYLGHISWRYYDAIGRTLPSFNPR